MDQVSSGICIDAGEGAAQPKHLMQTAAYNKPPYTRLETIVLNGFLQNAQPCCACINSPERERIYELRSYESATEGHINKVKMFNSGDDRRPF
jgi:hypothetical protein